MSKNFHLDISEPMVVSQGMPGDEGWGKMQFPFAFKTESGGIYVCWKYGSDDIYYDARRLEAFSDDGIHWRERNETDTISYPRMKNGHFFVGFVEEGTHKIDYSIDALPLYENGAGKRFLASDVKDVRDKTVYGIEIDGVSGEERVFRCEVDWPYMPFHLNGKGETYPATMMFSLCGFSVIETDGTLFCPIYTHGFNSDAASRDEALQKYPQCDGVYLFTSDDCGRTWRYRSQILVDDSIFDESRRFEGLNEPKMEKMPDGSLVMLIRSGSGRPSYITRSEDDGRTWSPLRKFDDIGVYPQIKSLACGVTLASYGRPFLRVRATDDPSGLVWQEPIEIPLSKAPTAEAMFDSSCFYTGILPLSDTEAMLVYSDFKYPNEDGIPVKSVLQRRITVVFDE